MLQENLEVFIILNKFAVPYMHLDIFSLPERHIRRTSVRLVDHRILRPSKIYRAVITYIGSSNVYFTI